MYATCQKITRMKWNNVRNVQKQWNTNRNRRIFSCVRRTWVCSTSELVEIVIAWLDGDSSVNAEADARKQCQQSHSHFIHVLYNDIVARQLAAASLVPIEPELWNFFLQHNKNRLDITSSCFITQVAVLRCCIAPKHFIHRGSLYIYIRQYGPAGSDTSIIWFGSKFVVVDTMLIALELVHWAHVSTRQHRWLERPRAVWLNWKMIWYIQESGFLLYSFIMSM